MLIRPRCGCRTSLLAFRRKGFEVKSVLCGTQPPIPHFQNFSAAGFGAGAFLRLSALLLAFHLRFERSRQSRGVPTGKWWLVSSGVVCRSKSHGIAGAASRDLAAAPRHEEEAHREAIPALDPAIFHQWPPGGRVVKPAAAPQELMILIPAFNEVGAIAGVIHEVRAVMPGV